jgi:hypothetical protein
LAFMLVLVPEPVWNTSSGKWSSAPNDTSGAARGSPRRRPWGSPEAAVDRSRHPLIEPRAGSARRHPLAGDREVLDGPLRLRAPPGNDRGRHSPNESLDPLPCGRRVRAAERRRGARATLRPGRARGIP